MKAPVMNILQSFLFVQGGEIRYFIHRNDFVDESEFDKCVIGSIVEFDEKEDPKGWGGGKARLVK